MGKIAFFIQKQVREVFVHSTSKYKAWDSNTKVGNQTYCLPDLKCDLIVNEVLEKQSLRLIQDNKISHGIMSIHV